MGFRVVEPTAFEWLTRGEPPERHCVPAGGLIHIEPGTPLQSVNHTDDDLLVYVHGMPPESETAEILDSAI